MQSSEQTEGGPGPLDCCEFDCNTRTGRSSIELVDALPDLSLLRMILLNITGAPEGRVASDSLGARR